MTALSIGAAPVEWDEGPASDEVRPMEVFCWTLLTMPVFVSPVGDWLRW